MRKISIVIPMRNEEGNIRELIGSLRAFMPSLGVDWGAVLIDDFSGDGTLALAEAFSGKDIRVLAMSHRIGQAAALQTGIDASDGDWILTMDADLENDIADLPKLLSESGQADMVVGGRWRRHSSLPKRAASSLFRVFCSSFFGGGLRDVNSPFRLFKREVVAGLKLDGGMHRYLTILAKRQGFKVVEVEVSHRPRRSGKSKYPPLSRLWPTVRDFVKVLREGRK